MIPPEISKVIRLLTEATTQSKVNWIPAIEAGIQEASEQDDYVVSMPDYSINVWRTRSPSRAGFTILGPTGQMLSTFYADTADEEYPTLDSLVSAAAWKAAKVDDILSDLEKALSQGKVLGKKRSSDDIPF